LGVGRLVRRLLPAAQAPYIVLGCCYALLATTKVTLFTVGGVVLATVTTVVVLAHRVGAASGPDRQHRSGPVCVSSPTALARLLLSPRAIAHGPWVWLRQRCLQSRNTDYQIR